MFEKERREIIKLVNESAGLRTTQDFLKSYPLEHLNQPLRYAIKIGAMQFNGSSCCRTQMSSNEKRKASALLL